jgi:hypothetical protein
MKEMLTQASPRLPKHKVDEIGDRVWKRLEVEMEKHDLSLRSLYGDGWNCPPLEQDELQILTAAHLLGGQGTMASILQTVEKWAPDTSTVAVVLEGLEAKGLVESLGTGEPLLRRFQVTEVGERSLRRAKAEGKRVVTAREGVVEEKSSRNCPRSPARKRMS